MADHFSVHGQDPSSAMANPGQAGGVKARLLDRVRETVQRKHYIIRTEQSYIDWIKRYIYFHGKQHPGDLNESHVTEFLNYLAVQKKVASSTQNQALCAIVFLYREVIKKDLGRFENLVHAKRSSRLPVVFTPEEIRTIFLQLDGVTWIMGQLLYGAGLRVMACVRLRIKDIDFCYKQIIVRDGKGRNDRVTMLPEIVIEPLSRHLEKTKKAHENDLKPMPGGGIPLIGSIAGGTPIEAVENLEEVLAISPELFGQGQYFGLRVRGDSMTGAHIMDGDIAIIRVQQRVESGRVAAVLVQDMLTEATLKIVRRKGNILMLEPANRRYKPLLFKGAERRRVAIIGKLAGIVRRTW